MSEDHQCQRGAFNALGVYFEETFNYIKDKELSEGLNSEKVKFETFQEFMEYISGIVQTLNQSVQEEG